MISDGARDEAAVKRILRRKGTDDDFVRLQDHYRSMLTPEKRVIKFIDELTQHQRATIAALFFEHFRTKQ